MGFGEISWTHGIDDVTKKIKDMLKSIENMRTRKEIKREGEKQPERSLPHEREEWKAD